MSISASRHFHFEFGRAPKALFLHFGVILVVLAW
jgi:hypothetical protein